LNWLEIDKILWSIIARHDVPEDMLVEAEKQFKWNRSQSEAALLPLLKRNTFKEIPAKLPKTRSKNKTKRK
jgi:1,6-anhydro-N-acetylmuramate kinase